MDARRRPQIEAQRRCDDSDSYLLKASAALPLRLYLTNGLLFALFFSLVYYLLLRWREKIRNSTPLHIVTLSEITAVLTLLASLIYLLGFFGVAFVQSLVIPRASDEDE